MERPEVDAERIDPYGIRQSGYWVPRALAFEHRIAVPFIGAEGAGHG